MNHRGEVRIVLSRNFTDRTLFLRFCINCRINPTDEPEDGRNMPLLPNDPKSSLPMRALSLLPVFRDDVSTRSLLPPSPQCPIELDQAAKFVASCARQRKFGSVKRSLTVQRLQVSRCSSLVPNA